VCGGAARRRRCGHRWEGEGELGGEPGGTRGGDWGDLARATAPALYGRSWVPWLRLVLLVAVVAVVLIAGRALIAG
jgi:hypothetical protein